jgi:hypothetical protein
MPRIIPEDWIKDHGEKSGRTTVLIGESTKGAKDGDRARDAITALCRSFG